MAKITDANFNQIFKSWLKHNPNDWRMIRPASKRESGDLNEDQSMAWFHYLEDKGMMARYRTWKDIIAIGRFVMVPCECPDVFDLSYSPKSRPPALPKRTEAEMAHMRERLSKLFRALALEMRSGKPSPIFEAPAPTYAKPFIDHTAPLPPLSDRARRILDVA
jgi:hypothetical protein